MSSSEQSVLLQMAPAAPHSKPDRDRPLRFRLRWERMEIELRHAGFFVAVESLALACNMPLPLIHRAIDSGCTKATARRLVRGVTILTGRRYHEGELVEDLSVEAAA